MNPSLVLYTFVGIAVITLLISIWSLVLHLRKEPRPPAGAVIDGEVSGEGHYQLLGLPSGSRFDITSTSNTDDDVNPEHERIARELIDRGVIAGSDLWDGDVAHRIPPYCLEKDYLTRYFHQPRHGVDSSEGDDELALSTSMPTSV